VPDGWEARLGTLPGVSKVERHDAVFRIESDSGPATDAALIDAVRGAGIAIQSLAIQSTTLDDVFVYYTGRALRDSLQSAPAHDFSFMRR
jgi:hypothetical protein